MVPETWNPTVGGELLDPRDLATRLLADDPDTHLTVSGGEPTEQPDAVGALLRAAHELGRTTWVYSGRTLDELLAADDDAVLRMLAETDVLIDGRYEETQPTRLPYRGSANQRLLNLTGAIPSESIGKAPSAVSLTLDDGGGLVVVGVPPPGFLVELQARLHDRGITVRPEEPWR